ncbi:SpoIIE family protein phosphatase [Mycobacterium deserti]|uniref:SpoIIE family protein phosphatase n=1 Tax=Mycobacterium deserti TaxID=2978347 RepID=A0ABT2MGQ1_9MYCO|nr:SpoIIE family protein phosphatase [Mycobacterium deserti]MCT7661461.1 SpoIIE family protein phosphatase [Mycobacterium deserti]
MSDFYDDYADALAAYLRTGDEASLAVGHDLGRRALGERRSVLEIIENHFRLVQRVLPDEQPDPATALHFLLQALAAVDVATRGFLDGTARYEQQRARADTLADRDEFRSALVNSLQEGFFVADQTGTVVEMNDAFAEITGYGPDGMPYRMPHPWVDDEADADARWSQLRVDGGVTAETPIRHRDGHRKYVVVAVNEVKAQDPDRHAYVGTIRDITSAHAATERERAVARLATAVSVAKSVDEVLSIMLAQCRIRLDARRLMVAIWQKDDGDPTVHVAGDPHVPSWQELDPDWRRTFEDARDWLPLTVTPVGAAPSAGTTRGFVAVLSGARDVVWCLEHNAARRVSAEDRHLVTALVGHLSLAMQHVRQFENSRKTSLTLQRSMLAPSALLPGFAVRYEPAVQPLEIGGDFYDVLELPGHRIGIVVGDCVGRGLPAAAVMGQLRASARALLLTGAEPATVLTQLDAVAALIPDAFCTTVFVAIVDTDAGMVRYSNAGHVPPVLTAGPSARELLTDGRSVPLAVQCDDPRPQAARPLAARSTLLIYTDGLVERRTIAIDNQIDLVAGLVADNADLPVETVADIVLSTLAPEQGYDDDVAIVIYRHAHAHAPLVIDTPADARQLTDIRHRLSAWLATIGVTEERSADIVLVVNEACSNCVEHAYRGRDRDRMCIQATERDANVVVSVSDSGSWKKPPADPGTRGRGLPLIHAVSDDVTLEGTEEGTTIAMTFRLSDGPQP